MKRQARYPFAALALLLLPSGALAQRYHEIPPAQMPPSVFGADVSHPLGAVDPPQPALRPPVAPTSPVPVPKGRIDPVVPIPKPGEVRHPVPPPYPPRNATRAASQPAQPAPEPQAPAPIASPWELPDAEAAKRAEWQPTRCYVKRRGDYRELRCRMALRSASPLAPATPDGDDAADGEQGDDSDSDGDERVEPDVAPAVGPAGEVQPPSSPCGTPEEGAVVARVNAIRRARGLMPVSCDAAAARAARAHSKDMCERRYFAHRSPEGRAPWDRLRAAGGRFSAAAENIARGYATAASVVEGWMTSPGHRQNILNPDYSHVGVGVVDCGGKATWTQVLLKQR